ncbi:HpcH/HpaI aldolase/citrate lyase family protein [Yersinia pestis]|uniref:HpcH/HpaI aldolase/citrate lyase family protein n=1 Tax=Yersinia pestis TaxID=632 RepID=UPI00057848CC|nr:HpcH/HpaI aldolase/citrate lyase family protein [Yersinia pestis]
MKSTPSAYALGATLYMPATRTDIADIIIHNKISGLRSLVICLEDAVSEDDVPLAISQLSTLLGTLAVEKKRDGSAHWPLIFVRPRHEAMGLALITRFNLSAINGFVLPKFTQASITTWWEIMKETHLCMMPTLETEDVFDVAKMSTLARELENHPSRQRIVALRIGGNDLMSVISMRRSRKLTLYDGPMGYVIKMLVSVFCPKNFALTAPVCEQIDNPQLLETELALDIAHGLVGKTAIHPSQIEVIQRALMVDTNDHADALRILNSTQAVFKSQGAMCEPSTHKRWAAAILERAQYYGIMPDFTAMAVRDAPRKHQSG